MTGNDARVLSIADQAVYARVVPDGHVGLLYVDGELAETLKAGPHAFWRYERGINVELVDLRVKTLEIQGQEILTRDKVALRINVTATYQFVDAAKAARAVKDPLDLLYKEIQFGLRASVGTRNLDALLEDIILPADMNELLDLRRSRCRAERTGEPEVVSSAWSGRRGPPSPLFETNISVLVQPAGRETFPAGRFNKAQFRSP
jgi:hypothetical protein